MNHIQYVALVLRAQLAFLFSSVVLLICSSILLSCGSAHIAENTTVRGGEVKIEGLLEEELLELFVNSRSFDAASPLAQKLYREHPKKARPAYLLGVILREKGVFEESKRFLLEAISRDPTHSDAYDALGILHGVQGQLEEALSAHKRATEIMPKNPKYWHNYGFALSVSKKFQAAIKAFQKSLSLAPDQKRTFVNLGFAHGALGQFKEMRRYLSQALKAAEVEFNIGFVMEKRGELSEAISHYKSAISLNPHLTQARSALERLEP